MWKETREAEENIESSSSNLELDPKWLQACTLATSATMEIAKFFALQNLRDDWIDDEDESGLLQKESGNGEEEKADDSARNLENISELESSVNDDEEVENVDFIGSEKEVVIPKIFEQKETEEAIDDFLETSVDELLKGLSDEEDDVEEPLWDETDSWECFDYSSPRQEDQSLNLAIDNVNEELLQSGYSEESIEPSDNLERRDEGNDDKDPFNDTATSEEMLKEISDNMTAELLNLFGVDDVQSNLEETTAVVENSRDRPDLVDPVVKNPTRAEKRLLPLWMRVGHSDPKYFKVDHSFQRLTQPWNQTSRI